MKRKVLSIFLCFVMILTVIPMTAFADNETSRTVYASGICGAQGDNLTWTLYDDGELVISGEGEMDNYYVDYYDKDNNEEKFPTWYDYYSKIDVITLEEGVTSIGRHAFTGDNIGYYKVNLPKSLSFYYGHPFRANHNNCKQGQYCVISYAGSESDWDLLVRQKGSSENFNDFIYQYGTRHFTVKFDSEDMQPAIDLTAIGLDRMNFTEEGERDSIKVYYYTAGIEDAKIRWTVNGDSVSYEPRIDEASGLETTIVLVAQKYGEAEIKAELVDAEGNVLDSDSVTVKVIIPKGMNIIEKAEYYATEAFLYMGAYGLAFSFAFGLFLEALLSAPLVLINMIFGYNVF